MPKYILAHHVRSEDDFRALGWFLGLSALAALIPVWAWHQRASGTAVSTFAGIVVAIFAFLRFAELHQSQSDRRQSDASLRSVLSQDRWRDLLRQIEGARRARVLSSHGFGGRVRPADVSQEVWDAYLAAEQLRLEGRARRL